MNEPSGLRNRDRGLHKVIWKFLYGLGNRVKRAVERIWKFLWKWIYVLLYVISLIVVAIFILWPRANSLLERRITSPDIGSELEFITIVTYGVVFIALQARTPKMGANITGLVKAIFIGIALIAITGLVILFNDLMPIGRFITVLVLIIGIAVFDFVRWRGRNPKERLPLETAIVWCADLPLVVGLILVTTFSLMVIPHKDVNLFLGGALTFKLGYYYGAYCLLNTFLDRATTS